MKTAIHALTRFNLYGLIFIFITVSFFAVLILFFSKERETIYVDLTYFPQDWKEEPMPPLFTETNAIEVGDSVYDWSGRKIVEIKNVEKLDWKGARKSIVLTAEINVVYNDRTHQYTFNDSPILIGNKFTIQTQRTVFIGQIINVYKSPSHRYDRFHKREADMVIQLRRIEDWQAESLRNFQVKDSSGNTIVQTKDILIKPAEIDVESDKGIIYKGYSTIYKDVNITTALKSVYCSDNTCYFANYYPLKVGSKISLHSNTDSIIDGSIVSFILK